MVKTKSKKTPVKAARASAPRTSARAASTDTDAVYILKLVLYLILGSQWLRITRGSLTIPLPLGVIIGILFAHTERYPVDRRIQYAILLLSMFIGFWLPIGFELVF